MDDAPLAHHKDPVAKAHQLEHVGGNDDDGRTPCCELRQDRVDLGAGADVDSCRRFVANKDVASHDEDTAEDDLLLISARERQDRRFDRARFDIESLRDLVGGTPLLPVDDESEPEKRCSPASVIEARTEKVPMIAWARRSGGT